MFVSSWQTLFLEGVFDRTSWGHDAVVGVIVVFN